MSSITAKKMQQKLTEEIHKNTHFSKPEIEILLKFYGKIVKGNNGKMDRIRFRDVLQNDFGMTDDILMDRIFRAFDKDNDLNINMAEWIMGMSVFLRGCTDEHLLFCFDVYDLNGDGFISREEMFHLLKSCLPKNQMQEEDPDEGVRDLVELTFKKVDMDGDGRVSLADFQGAGKQDSLLMQCLGDCLPRESCIKAYEKKIKERSYNY